MHDDPHGGWMVPSAAMSDDTDPEPERPPHEAGAPPQGLTYAAAGVDIDAGEEAVRRIGEAVRSTHIPGVLGGLGGFGGLFELPSGLRHPVLVGATDGVGTKLLLAQQLRRLDTVGIDLVAMSVNDVLTLGARPLFFLDYVATGRLVPQEMEQIVGGVAEGCRQAGCALIGGEMAEMPGLYALDEFDLAGFCVGVVEREAIIDGSKVAAGDTVLGLVSSGIHSNGYSLVRKILEAGGPDVDEVPPLFEETLGELLLRPTRIYVKSVLRLLEHEVPIHGMAHITGGGLAGNLARVIPDGLSARLHLTSWQVPRLFRLLQDVGRVEETEMFRTFNMGVGFVVVVPHASAPHATALLERAGEQVLMLGRVVKGGSGVSLEGEG